MALCQRKRRSTALLLVKDLWFGFSLVKEQLSRRVSESSIQEKEARSRMVSMESAWMKDAPWIIKWAVSMPVGSLERKDRNFSRLILPHILHLCADTSYCPFNSLSPRLCIRLSSTHIFDLETTHYVLHSCFWMFTPFFFRKNPTCPIRCHRSSSVPALFC